MRITDLEQEVNDKNNALALANQERIFAKIIKPLVFEPCRIRLFLEAELPVTLEAYDTTRYRLDFKGKL